MSARDELAREVLWGKRVPTGGSDSTFLIDANAAHSIAELVDAAGYRKPRVLGYVVVDRDNEPLYIPPLQGREKAQEIADSWTKENSDAGIDWSYRVAEIVEAAS